MLSNTSLPKKLLELILNFKDDNNIVLNENEISKVYSIEIDGKPIQFRLGYYDDSFRLFLKKEEAPSKNKKPFFKKNELYLFDKILNRWFSFHKNFLKTYIENFLNKKFQLDSKTYGVLNHALSDSEKELLSMGKDITANFSIYNKTNNKIIGSEYKRITADLSCFLTPINSPLKIKNIHAKDESHLLKLTNNK